MPKQIDQKEKLFKFFEDDQIPTDLEAGQILRDAGYNIEQINEQIKAIVQKAISISPHNWRNHARREREKAKEAFQRLRSTINTLDHSSRLDALHSFASTYRLSLAHRNLEDMSDSDFEELLSEYQYLISLDSDGNQIDQ